jgi:hypothetical protein
MSETSNKMPVPFTTAAIGFFLSLLYPAVVGPIFGTIAGFIVGVVLVYAVARMDANHDGLTFSRSGAERYEGNPSYPKLSEHGAGERLSRPRKRRISRYRGDGEMTGSRWIERSGEPEPRAE